MMPSSHGCRDTVRGITNTGTRTKVYRSGYNGHKFAHKHTARTGATASTGTRGWGARGIISRHQGHPREWDDRFHANAQPVERVFISGESRQLGIMLNSQHPVNNAEM